MKRKPREVEFCKKTLKPILEGLNPYIENLRYRHGNTEFGKDFTFSYVNPLNQRINVGLQAKWGDVKGSSKSLLKEIVDQIRIAFSVPYESKPHGKELYLNEIYVVCSGKYRDNAIQIINSTLERNYNVHFLDGSNIADLGKKVTIRKANEERNTKRGLNALLIELDQNLKTAKMIDREVEKSIEEKSHFLVRYRLNCLEMTLGLDIDDEWILPDAINLWHNLTMMNTILGELGYVTATAKWKEETKNELSDRNQRNIRNLKMVKEHVTSYLDSLQ